MQESPTVQTSKNVREYWSNGSSEELQGRRYTRSLSFVLYYELSETVNFVLILLGYKESVLSLGLISLSFVRNDSIQYLGY
jgi:hypothetical protein